MKELILMGDEAVAQAAIDAGIRGAFAYPGTPSTEIFEYVMTHIPEDRKVHAAWSTNEKVAYEEALGMSYSGGRSIVSMKHVGLNVAADPFMNSAITGVNGGLLVCVADDPGMHSSQNEQDSRYYSEFGFVPCLEPSSQQEAYDMVYQGLAFSEKVGMPIMIRLVTRLSHSRAPVVPQERIAQPMCSTVSDSNQFILLPVNARRKWARLTERWPVVEQALWELPFNELVLEGRRLGVITSGVAHNYFKEVAREEARDASYLKIGTFPPPRHLLRQLFEHCDEILVMEDGYPFIESRLRGWLDHVPKPVRGKLDNTLPRTGELTPTLVRRALGLASLPSASPAFEDLAGRPPALCRGCPHSDTYRAINEVFEEYPDGRVFSDIGCYTLGALPPYQSIDTCVDMGASVSMAVGAAAGGVFPSLAVIGDSTFAHSGITPLVDAVNQGTNMVLIIVDNDTVAMTGRQETALSGDRLVSLLKGAGVHPDHIRVFNPLPKRHAENVAILREEIAYEGLSVVIPTRPCIQKR